MSKLHRTLLSAVACAAMVILIPATVHAGNAIVIVTGTKTVSGSFVIGGTATYTVVLSNSGNTAQQDNPGNEFTDVLPAGLTLISATASSGTAVATVATNTATWDGSIANGGSVTITITATIIAGTGGQTISNQGTISYDSDNNGTNDASALTDDPGTQTANDPTSFVVTGTPVRLQSFDVN